MYLVAEVVRGADICTGSSGTFSFEGVRPYAFHGCPVFAAPEDRVTSWSGIAPPPPWGGLESGALTWCLTSLFQVLLNYNDIFQ